MDMQIVKRTNEHLHEPDEQAVSCQDVKNCVKRKASETQDSSHFFVEDSLLAVSEGVSVKLPKLNSLKRTIQRQREQGLVEVRQAKFISCAQPSKRVKTQGNEQALKDLILSYMYRPRMEFLRGIAHHLNMDSH